ncbi:MAG: sterol desaturase family protein [Pseudomonadota bacterium]
MNKPETKRSDFARQWHYLPDVPVQTSPLFAWPPDPAKIGRWFAGSWFTIGENIILAGLAFICWAWFQPSLETTKSLEAGWILQIYIRNIILMFLVAGGLHWYFHSGKKQDERLKFDPREVPSKGRIYTFNNQLYDNMFWTLASGVTLWTAYETLMFWAMANGYAPVTMGFGNPVWFAAVLFLTPLWISFHFYWIHRFLHWPPLYKLAHALHHRNTNVGPWSGLSMHPIETLLFFSSVLVHFLIASHPIHILFHMQHQALTAATSHTGFEGLEIGDQNRLALGRFHHQMHHRYFECNYGNLEMPWDKLFGSWHDGTQEAHERMKERRKQMQSL